MITELGRIVVFKVNAEDANWVTQRRLGHGGPGTKVQAGDEYPAVVVGAGADGVNLQVLLDGPDRYWATNRIEGDEPGQWRWPLDV